VRLLLDTHTFLWFVSDSAKLSATALELIEDGSHEKLISIASLWEMAIKVSIGKLVLNRPFKDIRTELIDKNGFGVLPITFEQSVCVSTLPFDHRDPFDRLLIAQSLTEKMPIISIETPFDLYGVQRLW
jgi:PIN domain nuclease of toxin-antitoxin system